MIDLDEDPVPAQADTPSERLAERITLMVVTLLAIAIIAISIWDISTVVAGSA